MNIVHIAGNLGADPEVRFTSTGKKVTTLRVAARSRKGQNEETIWYRVTIWGEQFDKLISYLKKGSSAVVVGELQKPEIFTDREGKPQISSLEVTAFHLGFSPFGKGSGGGSATGQSQEATPFAPQQAMASAFSEAAPNPYLSGYQAGPKGETHDDEVPF